MGALSQFAVYGTSDENAGLPNEQNNIGMVVKDGLPSTRGWTIL